MLKRTFKQFIPDEKRHNRNRERKTLTISMFNSPWVLTLLSIAISMLEYRTTVREDVGLNLAGPILRVFKELSRKCCICNYICKSLDSLFFSYEEDKPTKTVVFISVLESIR